MPEVQDPPIIVTGCGRSGTHWLGGIMVRVLGEGIGAFEPRRYEDIGAVVVDSRLRHRVAELRARGHTILHLVRDGRDVVRSLDRWYEGTRPLEQHCREWADAVDMMQGFPVLRLEDLTARADPSAGYVLSHWSAWDERTTETFWRICGPQMERMGYVR